MVQEADAQEKPGRPTFFETPTWSFNIEWSSCGVIENGTGGRRKRLRIGYPRTGQTVLQVSPSP
jgi:hypothetical protein